MGLFFSKNLRRMSTQSHMHAEEGYHTSLPRYKLAMFPSLVSWRRSFTASTRMSEWRRGWRDVSSYARSFVCLSTCLLTLHARWQPSPPVPLPGKVPPGRVLGTDDPPLQCVLAWRSLTSWRASPLHARHQRLPPLSPPGAALLKPPCSATLS
jgi:hypothetical protein